MKQKINLYEVTVQLPTETVEIYYGSDLATAEVEFKSASEQTEYTEEGNVELTAQRVLFEFLLDEDELEDFRLSDNFDDSEIWMRIADDEPVVIKSSETVVINSKSNAILEEVDQHFHNVYGNYKYNEFFVKDDKIVVLRIADHTENIYNNDRFNGHADYIISVVIADNDPTAERFGNNNQLERRSNEMTMTFNSDYTAQQIIDIVTNTINAL